MPSTRRGKRALPPNEAELNSELPSEDQKSEAGPSAREGPAEPQGSKPEIKRQKRSVSPSPESLEPVNKPSVPAADSEEVEEDDEEDQEDEEDVEDQEDQEEPETPLTSDPCTCRCGGCCCHAASEVKHCVRCHKNYTFNHSTACQPPHVYDGDKGVKLWVQDLINPSMCCGADVVGGTFNQGDVLWAHHPPCYSGWHTTNVQEVEPQFNGSSIVRCIRNSEGKCKRRPLKGTDPEVGCSWGVRAVDKEDRQRRNAELQHQNSPSAKCAEKDLATARRNEEEERRQLIQRLNNPLANPFVNPFANPFALGFGFPR